MATVVPYRAGSGLVGPKLQMRFNPHFHLAVVSSLQPDHSKPSSQDTKKPSKTLPFLQTSASGTVVLRHKIKAEVLDGGMHLRGVAVGSGIVWCCVLCFVA